MVVEFKDVLDKMLKTYIAKNNDYGDSFTKSLDKHGLIASIVRMEDKMNRLVSLVENGTQKVKDESIQDTLLDLANYSAMTCMYLRNKSNETATFPEYEEGWYVMDLDLFFDKGYFMRDYVKDDLNRSAYELDDKRVVEVYIKPNGIISYEIQLLGKSIGYGVSGYTLERLGIKKMNGGVADVN